jgi:peptide/nickel transport system substrate-binding protein
MQDFFQKLGSFAGNFFRGLALLFRVRTQQLPPILESFTKKEVFLVITFAVLILISGGFLIFGKNVHTNGPAFGGEHVEGLLGQPRFINPVLAASSPVDSDLSRLVYAQILKFDNNLNLVPDLAESLPEISPDQKTYTIKLRPDLKWQDGRPIRADDFIFTISVIQDEAYESPLRTTWSRVKAEKINDLTVSFTLREVSTSFITNFTLGILPKHAWENTTPTSFRLSESNLSPVGSGPFMVREIKKTTDGTVRSITLRANANYHEGRPYLDRVTFRFYPDYENLISAFQSREISAYGFTPVDKRDSEKLSSKHEEYQLNLPQYQAVFLNLKTPPFSDKAVRQAVWLATERRPIIDDIYSGLAHETFGPILEGNLGYNPSIKEKNQFNLEEAGKILDKAGWVFNEEAGVRIKNNKPLEFSIATNNFITNVRTAQMLQSQWSRIGANVQLTILSAVDLQQQYMRPRSFDALLFSENTGADPDPFSFWHSSQARDPGHNLSGFSNSEADKLLTAARQTNDFNVREQNYFQFQNIILNEIPAVFLTSPVYSYRLPKKIKGFEQNTLIVPQDRFVDIQHWYIEE